MLMVIVILAVPCWPEIGLTVTVRFVPLPPNTILAGGTNEVSDDPPDNVSEASGTGPFVIVKGKGPVKPFTGMVWSAMADNLGTKVPGWTSTLGPAAKLLDVRSSKCSAINSQFIDGTIEIWIAVEITAAKATRIES